MEGERAYLTHKRKFKEFEFLKESTKKVLEDS
jgi:hypothetical protein